MSKLVSKFNGLHGRTVNRAYLVSLKNSAKKENNKEIESRISNLLLSFPDADNFDLEIDDPISDNIKPIGLSIPDYQYLEFEEAFATSDEDNLGLGKAIPPEEIYQMITDKVLNQIKKVNKKDYKRKWETKGYLIAYNFESKKPYKGVNQLILGGFFDPIPNPYYLTFKQVKELGGTVRKGSEGQEVIYYTKYEKEVTKKVKDEFGKETGETKEVTESFYAIRYYNVFNGSDIDGIDFDLDNFNLAGKIKNEVIAKGKNQPIEAADLIISNYPKPQPTINHGGIRAYFDPENDVIQLPEFQSFESSQDYYRTAFHELSHSTLLPNRLNRNPDIYDRKEYAFEELVAEFGAVFLSSQAGIIFYTNKNHAAYLKGWNEALTQMKDDNRFLIKAGAAAQKIADYILQFDENGNPLYLKHNFESEKPNRVKKSPSNYGKKTKFVSKPKTKKAEYPFSKDDIPYETAYRAHTGTSFSPEKRAEMEKNRYFEALKELYDKFFPKAKEAGKEIEFTELFSKLQTGFLNRFLKYLTSRHGFYSTMIAGPAKFPVSRMEKKSRAIDSNLNDFIKYLEYGEKKLNDLVTPESEKPIKSGSDNALLLLKEKLSKLETFQKRANEANKQLRAITKKHSDFDVILDLYKKALAEIGFSDKDIIGITQLGEREKRVMWLSMGTTNNAAEIRRIKARIETEERLVKKDKDTTIEKKYDFNGGYVELDYSENRIKIYFDTIPDAELRSKLKGAGYAFKWSPKNKAWQRQLNTFRLEYLERILSGFDSQKKHINSDSSPQLELFEKGMAAPAVETIYIDTPVIVKTETISSPIEVHSNEQAPVAQVKKVLPVTTSVTAEVISEIAPKHKTLGYLMANDEVNELYQIPGDVGAFLGDVEIKPKESVVITLSSPQGGGKTRTLLQFANAYAYNYSVKIFSLEEHVESKVFKDKIAEYIDPANFERISVDSELPKGIDTIHEAVKDFDIIMTDSWQKMLEINSRLSLDQDFRKKYDGKTFLFIYQQTSDGKMRGGSTSQFDGDIILFVEKFPDYRKSYVYPNKNRYTKIPLDQLKYNIYSGKMDRVEEEFETETINQ